MRLADFIETNIEAILAEWVTFAETCGPAGATLDLTGLRDHAVAMLHNMVADLRTPQTKAEQAHKSTGAADSSVHDDDTAAEVHGAPRLNARAIPGRCRGFMTITSISLRRSGGDD